jgi:hypothetical protein
MKNKAFKIAAVVFVALVLVLVAVALSGCTPAAETAVPVVPAGPQPGAIQPAGENRSLGELLSIARGDVPEPANLSVADRDVVAKMRSARR